MSTQKAYIFPGQGSQKKGMGADLLESSSAAREILKKADEIASFSLSALIKEDADGQLNQTLYTQPALFTVSAMYLAAQKEQGDSYQAVAGHSLGEYSALYAAGAVSFEEGLKLVLKRGELMDQVNEDSLGMAALLGADLEALETVLKDTEDLYIANLNSPDQTVVSGTKEALKTAEDKLKDAGVKRIFPLKVSGAFHSPFMAPVKEAFAEYLQECPLQNAEVALYPNILAEPVKDADKIRQCLIEQMTGRVRWVETIGAMQKAGLNEMVECGPGKVLSGLVKKINRDINCISLG